MSSGDFDCGRVGYKSSPNNFGWTGPKQVRETLTWQHETGTVVQVSASAAGASHRDELVWSVIVRPDGRDSPGRRITQSYLDSRQGAVERAEQYVAEHADGSLPTSSYDEWGVEVDQ